MNYTTTATFTDRQPGDDVLTTIVARSVLEAALAEDEKAELWFEVGREDDTETSRLAIDLSVTDLEEILRLSPDDEIGLSLDGEAVESLFSDADADVEAHGLRGAIAIAVTGVAILVPTTQAANVQTAHTASTVQRAGIAATTQQVGTEATTQVTRLADHVQVGTQRVGTKQSHALVIHASGLNRGGFHH